MKSHKKSKRKTPKRARAKARRKPTADASTAETLYGSVLPALAPPESPIGLRLEHSLVGVSPEDALNNRRDREALEAELCETLEDLPARSLSELRRVGVNEREIAIHLSLIWQECQEKVKSLATIPGVPMAAIRRLPELMRRVGRQVSAINKHKVLQSIFLRRSREGLPGSLYSYARALEEKLSARKGRTLKTRQPGTATKVQFIRYVLETSRDRKQHYRAIAELINAFNDFQDGRYEVRSRRVTAESLKQLWLEHKDLPIATVATGPPPVRTTTGLPGVTFFYPTGS